jgi:hypothetical protein
MKRCRGRSLVVIGTADPGYNEATLADLAAHRFQIATIAGADHGLERAGTARGSLEAWSEMVRHLENWFATRANSG